MEKTDVSIENEEQVPQEPTKVSSQVTNDVPKNSEETNGEVQTTEDQIEEENDEKNDDDEVVPSTTPKLTDEQENVTDTNTLVSAGISPGRANVPFKEVNESENETSSTVVNGTENINNKKRELDHEDEQIQEKILNNDERTGDQTKKMKITEVTDIPTLETNESENNGTTTVEV